MSAPRRPGHEVLLPGGLANRGAVVRVGDTVRRPQRPTSPAVHALLRHLEAVGFEGAPRFLGVDAQGREVLSYVPGVTPAAPHLDRALSDAALRSVAELLRGFHRAVAGFDPAPHTWPPPPPPPFAGELVGHNDLNVDNVVLHGDRAVALIDFDLAGPGSRVWDVACAVRLWAPLRPDGRIRDPRRGDAFRRLRVFADAYGLDDAGRRSLLTAVRENQAWFRRRVDRYAAAGHRAFAEHRESMASMPEEEYRRWWTGVQPLVREALGL